MRWLLVPILLLVLVPGACCAGDPARAGCESAIAPAIALAQSGQLDLAAAVLERATVSYPSRHEPWRELAGVRFRQREWRRAADAAGRALALDETDAQAWRLLGGARFMLRERDEALDAWNAIHAPTVEEIRIDGLERTRYAAVAKSLGVAPDDMLTSSSVRRARRRLELVPSVAAARVSYKPTGTGAADIDVSVMERPAWPHDGPAFVAFGARAVIERTAAVSLPSPTGGGEMWQASYRWWMRRPQALVAVEVPKLFGYRGNARIAASAETQTYASPVPGSPATAEEKSQDGTIALRQWVSSDWLYEGSAGFHHITGRGDFVSVGSALEWRSAGDGHGARAALSAWPRVDGREALITVVNVELQDRWTLEPRSELNTRIGWTHVRHGDTAPRALWPGAGTGEGRDGLLRAHPLISSGVIAGPAFAPSLAVLGIEFDRWFDRAARMAGAAAFIDGAYLPGQRPAAANSRYLADAGLGLRVRPPGTGGWFRLDLAVGLVDGTRAVSVGWEQAWRGAGR